MTEGTPGGAARVRAPRLRTNGLRFVGFVLVAAVALLLLISPLTLSLNSYQTNLFMQTATYAVATLGLVVLLGFTGQISLAQAAFFGIGAYLLGLGTTAWGLGFWEAFGLAAVVSAVAGFVLGLTTLRLGGHYLAMVTISFGVIVNLVLVNAVNLTKGPDGVTGIPRPTLFGLSLNSDRAYLMFSLVVLYAVGLLIYLLRGSILGRGMRAIRDNELAAEVIGVPTVRVKVISFTLGSMLGGIGGALYAAGFSYISPDAFTFTASVVFLTMVIIGGAASAIGGIFGTALLILLPEFLRFLQGIYLIVYGAAVVLFMVFMPDGVFGVLFSRLARLGRRDVGAPAGAGGVEDELAGPAVRTGEPLLVLSGLRKHFGGVKAVDGLDLEITAGTVHALIGPNGSGKTTALNVISGIYRPTGGQITFAGRSVARYRPHRLARLGLGRTFQLIRLCESMTVLENVVLGAQIRPRELRRRRALHQRAVAALEFVGLRERAFDRAGALPYGSQRAVEIARAVATRPRLLLLDEPAAGLNSREKQDLVDLLRRLVAHGITVLVIEHDMGLVESVADHITVLNFGRKIAEGRPADVLRNPDVIAAYLGDRAADAVA